ncbi:MAG: hypothetical protein V1772_13085, partial [Chloroflexota bacterium]
AEAMDELLHLAQRLGAAGDSRVCLISDTPELPPVAAVLGDGLTPLALGPLPGGDGAELLAARARLRPGDGDALSFARLADNASGSPLALGLLAEALRGRGLERLTADLEAILPGWGTGEARARNQAVETAIELTMRALSDADRGRLAGLGALARGFIEPLGLSLCEIAEELWRAAKAALVAGGVLHELKLVGYAVPYLWLHPALERYWARRLAGPQRSRLEAAQATGYVGFGQWLLQAESRSPESVRTLTRSELPNLRRALRTLLGRQELVTAVGFMGQVGQFLQKLGYAGEQAHLAGLLQQATQAALPAQGPLARPGVQLLLTQSETLVAMGRLPQAVALLQELIQRMAQEGGLAYSGDEAVMDRAVALHRYGRLAVAAGQIEAAYQVYAQALELLSQATASRAMRAERLALYEDLAELSLAAGQFGAAEEHCQRGLDLAAQLGDQPMTAALRLHLAGAHAARDQGAAAREQLTQALDLYAALDDKGHLSVVWERLGALALGDGQPDEALRSLGTALELARAAEQPLRVAQLHLHLAQVAESTDRLDAAAEHYGQAMVLYQQQDQRSAQASAELALAGLLLRRGAASQARVHAEAARVLAEGLADQGLEGQGQPWEAYALLQRIADAEGNPAAVARWRRRAREACAASPASEAVRQQWQPLIASVAASCRGAALSIETVAAVEELEKSADWQALAAAIWRVLGGERGDDLYDTLDHVDAFIVRAMLEAIAQPEAPEAEGDEQA